MFVTIDGVCGGGAGRRVEGVCGAGGLVEQRVWWPPVTLWLSSVLEALLDAFHSDPYSK